jgi:hypothetical protein
VAVSGPGLPRGSAERVEPIAADLCLLADCASAALVDGEGVLHDSTLLMPDQPSAAGPGRGSWVLRPEGPAETARRYIPDTMVLETTFTTPDGRAVLVDALLLGLGETGHHVGLSPPSALGRSVRVTEGTMWIACRIEPPLGSSWLLEDGVLWAPDGETRLEITGPAPDDIDGGAAVWRRQLATGSALSLLLRRVLPGPPARQPDALDWLDDTRRAWQSWSALQEPGDGGWRSHVLFSGRVLKALGTARPAGPDVRESCGMARALSAATADLTASSTSRARSTGRLRRDPWTGRRPRTQTCSTPPPVPARSPPRSDASSSPWSTRPRGSGATRTARCGAWTGRRAGTPTPRSWRG